MGWDGAGNYTRQHNFSADASAGIKILAARMDAELDDMASAFTRVWTRDGQNVPTQDLPMGGRRFVNVGAATSVGNYMRVREFIENVPVFMHDAETSADRISVSAQYFTSVSANQAPADGTGIKVRMLSDKSSAPLYLNGYSANIEYGDGSRNPGFASGGVYEFVYSSVDSVWKALRADEGRTSAEVSVNATGINYQFLATPIRDVSRYVSDNTGATDVRAEFQSAIDVNKNELVVPDGTYLIDGSLNPKSGTGIFGNGQNTQFKLADGADVPVIQFSATNLDYTDVHLRDFAINGNKANQTSSAAAGIYLTNSTGTSGLLAGHRLSNLYIFSTKGNGLHLGFAMRRSRAEDVFIYHCDGYGLYLDAHSDSLIKGFDVGQSGLHGVYVNGAGTITLADFKIWFSGRLGDGAGGTGGTNGHGLVVRNTSVLIAHDILTQENEGHGMRLFGDGTTMVGPVVTGFVSDGDNKEGANVAGATSWSAISLDNIDHARISGSIRRFSTAQGTVQYALNVSDLVDSNIELDIDPDAVLSSFVPATIADDNDIRINRSNSGSVTRGDVAATLVLGQTSHTQIWSTPLTVDRAVTLDATRAWRGGRFRIVRTAAATGAFNLNVGTGPLKALGIGEWCDIEFDGSAWFLAAYGAL